MSSDDSDESGSGERGSAAEPRSPKQEAAISGERLAEAQVRAGETYHAWSTTWMGALPNGERLKPVLGPFYAWARQEEGNRMNPFAITRGLRPILDRPFRLVLPRRASHVFVQGLSPWSTPYATKFLDAIPAPFSSLVSSKLANGLNYTLVSPLVSRWLERLRHHVPALSPFVEFHLRTDLFDALNCVSVLALQGDEQHLPLHTRLLDVWRHDALPLGCDAQETLHLLVGISGTPTVEPLHLPNVR